jgi:release factor glutamine methyltransferase
MTAVAPCEAPARAADLLSAAGAELSAAAVDAARLNAELLLAAALGVSRAALYARLHRAVPQSAAARFAELVARRLQREPLQYLLGHQELWSLNFHVTPDVLIPRPETERLVELALVLFPTARTGTALAVGDVGTGSGCLAIALAHEWPGARVTAIDRSLAALHVARANAERCGVAQRVLCVQGDLLAPVAGRSFDLIITNPPYVAAADLAAAQPELRFEPRLALDGGADGLEVIRRLLPMVPRHLRAGGRLLMEIGADQGAAVLSLARKAGANEAVIEMDLAGRPRVLSAVW